jgi:hypothetical protein
MPFRAKSEKVLSRRGRVTEFLSQDMVSGRFHLPWEDQVKITDGTSCSFAQPTRMFGKTAKAAE